MINLETSKMTKAIERVKAIRPRVSVINTDEQIYSVLGLKCGWVLWEVRRGTTKRQEKIYLRYAGKRQLVKWEKLDPPSRQEIFEAWVREERAKKGIRN